MSYKHDLFSRTAGFQVSFLVKRKRNIAGKSVLMLVYLYLYLSMSTYMYVEAMGLLMSYMHVIVVCVQIHV